MNGEALAHSYGLSINEETSGEKFMILTHLTTKYLLCTLAELQKQILQTFRLYVVGSNRYDNSVVVMLVILQKTITVSMQWIGWEQLFFKSCDYVPLYLRMTNRRKSTKS